MATSNPDGLQGIGVFLKDKEGNIICPITHENAIFVGDGTISLADYLGDKGNIINSKDIADKTTNTYSAEIIDDFNTYSTEEIIVGYYIKNDGTKVPRYRKEIRKNLTASNETILVGHPILKVEGIIESKYANGWLIPNHPHSSSNKDTYFCDLFISSGSIYLELGSSLYGSATTQANIKLTVEYYKTTD